ncbi:flagellar biosynthesis, cell-distal portion of basal-body rod [Klebsiella pneumoniae subsp. pneumoniae]|uniref:Flagellar biosynthesis, cell-distal portion of basal-body rod n=1 Tax=Klebsiella pneumoniae subsp. pneumoniae TaxID=72407 RepID=A0A377ZDS6_KLEPN|nr:flagellar biosynthesis, cell-distal portion of basal-body rod [Klebsiella pneumoniae subsp. pneumoniae]
MAFNPPLGSTNADVFMGNVQRLDELINGPAADVPDRAGDPLYSWRLIRQSLIPLSRQYMTLADAQADIANIPDGSATYVRSTDDSALADEYINNAGRWRQPGAECHHRFISTHY